VEHDDNQNLDIREKLLRLPKIQADENFLKRLQIQIDLLESEEKTRDVVVKGSVSGYFKNLFGARLVPALGISSVVVAAFLVYFVLADKKESVVSDITGNKNQETIVTPEKTNTAPPVTQSTEPVKTENNNTTSQNTEQPIVSSETKTQYGKTMTRTETFDGKGIQESLTSSDTEINLTTKSSTEQPVKIIEQPKNELANPNMKGSIRQPDTKTGTPDNSLKKETAKSDNNIKSKDGIVSSEERSSSTSESSINEGGRGKTEKSQKNTKPKKKDVNTINDINKKGLETLRDKIAK